MDHNSRINKEFTKQHAKARIQLKKRMEGFYSKETQEKLEEERLERLERLKNSGRELIKSPIEEKNLSELAIPDLKRNGFIGFQNAVKLVIEPTNKERRLGRIGGK